MDEKFHSYSAAVHTSKRYVCSVCFGQLEVLPHWEQDASGQIDIPSSWFSVRCQNYPDQHAGFVTSNYAVNTRLHSYIDLADVLENGIADLLCVDKVAIAKKAYYALPPMARIDPQFHMQIIGAVDRLHTIFMAEQRKSAPRMTAEEAIAALYGE